MKAVLTEVKKYATSEDFLADKEKHLASLEWETYGFVLEKAERLPLIPCRGKLGFWEFEKHTMGILHL